MSNTLLPLFLKCALPPTVSSTQLVSSQSGPGVTWCLIHAYGIFYAEPCTASIYSLRKLSRIYSRMLCKKEKK